MWLFRPAFAAAVWCHRGSLARHGLPLPSHQLLQEHPTISTDLPILVREGRVGMKPDIERLDGDGIRFVDGSRAAVDTVILATGYKISFPFLDAGIIAPDENQVRLYRNVVLPDVPGLYFVGLVQPWGAIFPLAEAQSHWVADLIEGRCVLPARAFMEQAIDDELATMRKRYVASPRHTIQVDFHAYRETLKRERQRLRHDRTVHE
jgi:hypothetical protein